MIFNYQLFLWLPDLLRFFFSLSLSTLHTRLFTNGSQLTLFHNVPRLVGIIFCLLLRMNQDMNMVNLLESACQRPYSYPKHEQQCIITGVQYFFSSFQPSQCLFQGLGGQRQTAQGQLPPAEIPDTEGKPEHLILQGIPAPHSWEPSSQIHIVTICRISTITIIRKSSCEVR